MNTQICQYLLTINEEKIFNKVIFPNPYMILKNKILECSEFSEFSKYYSYPFVNYKSHSNSNISFIFDNSLTGIFTHH